uniref:thermonuclease family protein n=1 Tax=Turicimonas muris TaxID=1796652 RepID=UPI00402A7F97
KIKIRLLGIDAPELKMEGGNASRRHLENLIRSGNNQVRIYYLSKKKFDRYGRIIGKVVTNNIDVNRQMVLDGHAWFYRNYQKDVMPKDRVLYQEAMYEAQRTKRGLWAQPNPLEPWEWRKTVQILPEASLCQIRYQKKGTYWALGRRPPKNP